MTEERPPTQPHRPPPVPTQPPWVGALQLLTLWSFALLQPLLDLLADNTTFFLYHHATWIHAALLVLLLVVPAAAAFWLLEWAAARLGPRVALAGRLLLLTALAVLFFVQPLGRSPLVGPYWVLPLALVAALTLAALYLRSAAIRRWLTLLSGATVIFAALFLLAPEVRALAERPRQAPRDASAEPADLPDVVVLVFDALPLSLLLDAEHRIDRDLFPNFARLAEMSHWFRNASTPASTTRLAVPALLTGNLTTDPGAATLEAHPDNLFTLLAGTHRIAATEAVTRLAPRSAATRAEEERSSVLGPIFSDLWVVYRRMTTPGPWLDRVPVVEENWGGFVRLGQRPSRAVGGTGSEPDDPRRRIFERFIESLKGPEGQGASRFYYLHSLLPHNPYRFLRSGRRYRNLEAAGDLRGFWWVDEQSVAPRRVLRQVLQTQFTDTLLGGVLDRLEREGLLPSSLLVVAADHGETLGPGEGSRMELHGLERPDDVLRVPLFIKRPGQRSGSIDDRNVDLRDVTPAIADLLGLELTWETEGRSPFAPAFPARQRKRMVDKHGSALGFPAAFAPDPATRRLLERYFPSRYAWRRLYRFGPLPEWVGRRVEELGGVAADYTVAIDDGARLRDLAADEDFWPVRISGTVALADTFPQALPEAVLALALDGRIEATTRARFRDRETRFSVMVDERAIRPGGNRIEVLVIDPRAEAVYRRPSPTG